MSYSKIVDDNAIAAQHFGSVKSNPQSFAVMHWPASEVGFASPKSSSANERKSLILPIIFYLMAISSVTTLTDVSSGMDN